MRKTLALCIVSVAIAQASLSARCGGKPTSAPPADMRVEVVKLINYLTPPYDYYTRPLGVYMYGEMTEEGPNATGSGTTALGTTSVGADFNPAIVNFNNKRLPAKWRFQVHLNSITSSPCYTQWAPARSMIKNGTYLYRCHMQYVNGQLVSMVAESASNSLTAGGGSGFAPQDGEITVDPTDIGEQLDADNQFMWPGDALVSSNGEYTLLYLTDGDLVLFNADYTVVWSSGTAGNGGGNAHVHLQDGDLVIYDANTNPVFSSDTGGNSGSRLVCQNDGNLVIYNSGNQPIWDIW